jgi:hypothetical protein
VAVGKRRGADPQDRREPSRFRDCRIVASEPVARHCAGPWVEFDQNAGLRQGVRRVVARREAV